MKKFYKRLTFSGAALLSAVLLAGCAQKEEGPSIKNAPAPAAPTDDAMPAPTMKTEEKMDDKMQDGEAMEKTDDAAYKDGTYTATGDYTAPPGAEKIDVSLTLKGGVITAVTVTPTATDEVSKKMQTAFAGGISTAVVGKSLGEAKVGVVSGSSLTPAGFNDAVSKIKTQAQAS